MIWDELPRSFEPAVIDAATMEAMRVERATPPGRLHILADALKTRGQGMEEDEKTLGQLLMSDGLACDFMLARGEYRLRWGWLAPMMEIGGAVYPPPVPTFPDSLEPYFRERASTTERSDARARYRDLLWTRWHSLDDAKETYRSYVQAADGADLTNPEALSNGAEYLERAADISRTLSFEVDSTLNVLFREIRRGLHDNDSYAYWLGLGTGDLLAERRAEETRRLVEEFVAVAAKFANARDRHSERSMLEVAEKLARGVGDGEQAKELRRTQAASYESEARERQSEGKLIELALLDDASRIYAEANAGSDVQRLKPTLAAAGKRAAESLHAVEVTVPVPREKIDQWAERLIEEAHSDPVFLLQLGDRLGLWISAQEAGESLVQAQADHPFQYLARRMHLAADGRVQPEPEDDDARRRAQEVGHHAQRSTFGLVAALALLPRLRERDLWNAHRLVTAVEDVDSVLGQACRDGVEAFEQERHWLALHALIPQLERAIRKLGEAVGANVYRRSRRGGLEWASLDSMLGDQAIAQALGAPLAQTLSAVYVDAFGPNYRNETSHGARDPADDHQGPALMTVLAVLSVAERVRRLTADK